MDTNQTLHEQVERLKEFLLTKGYSPKTLRNYSKHWGELIAYADESGCESYSTKMCSEFLKRGHESGDAERSRKTTNDSVRAVNLLASFLQSGSVAACQKRASLPVEYEEINAHYMDHLRVLGQQPKSLKTKQSRIRQFLLHISAEGINEIGALTKADLLKFMNHLKNRCSASGSGCILYTVKDFLAFCSSENAISNGIQSIIKGIHVNPNENLPSVYSVDEIKSLLGAVNRETPEGKKHFAMLSLMAVIGLRSSDVINLKLNDIKWTEGTLEFNQKKRVFSPGCLCPMKSSSL